MDAFEGQHQDLELYAPFDWQPVKLKEYGFISMYHIKTTGVVGRTIIQRHTVLKQEGSSLLVKYTWLKVAFCNKDKHSDVALRARQK